MMVYYDTVVVVGSVVKCMIFKKPDGSSRVSVNGVEYNYAC